MGFEYIDVAQNADEWLDLRAGVLTSSKLSVVMAHFGKAFGEPAKSYAINIAIEQITGRCLLCDYTNKHMSRGHEQEPIARMLYENETFCNVKNGGFFISESKDIGCSPDGLVSDDGVIEIKSVIASTHFSNVKRQSLDPAYKWQCIGNLMFTGREWLDFISYCADYPEDQQLFIHRIKKEDFVKEFKMINERMTEFLELVHKSKEIISNSDYRIN